MEISIDSRSVANPATTMFFALKGPNHNGHDYVTDLYRRGVRNFVVSAPIRQRSTNLISVQR